MDREQETSKKHKSKKKNREKNEEHHIESVVEHIKSEPPFEMDDVEAKPPSDFDHSKVPAIAVAGLTAVRPESSESLLNLGSVDEDAEIWILRCHKKIPLESIITGKKFKLNDQDSYVLEDSVNNSYELKVNRRNDERSSAALVALDGGAFHTISVPIRGYLNVTKACEQTMPPDINFQKKSYQHLPPGIKIRHPLYGTDFGNVWNTTVSTLCQLESGTPTKSKKRKKKKHKSKDPDEGFAETEGCSLQPQSPTKSINGGLKVVKENILKREMMENSNGTEAETALANNTFPEPEDFYSGNKKKKKKKRKNDDKPNEITDTSNSSVSMNHAKEATLAEEETLIKKIKQEKDWEVAEENVQQEWAESSSNCKPKKSKKRKHTEVEDDSSNYDYQFPTPTKKVKKEKVDIY